MIPKQAVNLAKKYEGFCKVVTRKPVVMAGPYICPAGYWTIAWGHLCAPDASPVTMEEGELLIYRDMASALSAVARECPRLLVEPAPRLAAVVDWTFNLGGGRLKSSTMRKRINEGRWEAAGDEMMKWVWGGGRKLPGLIARRKDEVEMLLRPESFA